MVAVPRRKLSWAEAVEYPTRSFSGVVPLQTLFLSLTHGR